MKFNDYAINSETIAGNHRSALLQSYLTYIEMYFQKGIFLRLGILGQGGIGLINEWQVQESITWSGNSGKSEK